MYWKTHAVLLNDDTADRCSEQHNCYLLWEDVLQWKTQSGSKRTDESPHVKGQFRDSGQQDTSYYGDQRQVHLKEEPRAAAYIF